MALALVVTACGSGSQSVGIGAKAAITTTASSDDVDSLVPMRGGLPSQARDAPPMSRDTYLLGCPDLVDKLTRGDGPNRSDRPFAVPDAPANTTAQCWVGRPDGHMPPFDGSVPVVAGVIYIPKSLDPNVATLFDFTRDGGLLVSVTFNATPPPFPPESQDGTSHRRVDVPGAVDDRGNPGKAVLTQDEPKLVSVTWNIHGGRAGVERVSLLGEYPARAMLDWARTAFRTRDGQNPDG
jgi:hypothetical protein